MNDLQELYRQSAELQTKITELQKELHAVHARIRHFEKVNYLDKQRDIFVD